jgi:hypothetical protein
MISTFLTSAVFTLLTIQTPAMLQAAPVEVPRWSSYDMTLTATGQYDSPYVSVDLLGVFSGPDGEAIVIKGFWDGGRTFRIRFTPTQEGAWSYMTVSDDPGLDAHGGTITCVKPAAGSHGFVRQRQSGDGPAAWVYDDGTAVSGDAATANVPTAKVPTPNVPTVNVPTVNVRSRMARCGSTGDPCDAPIGPGRDYVDIARLQATDKLVTDALAAGRLAEIGLFDPSDAAAADGQRVYRYVEYMAARYGAYPNVVWCMHPTASSDSAQTFWLTARSLVSTLDPYFAQPPRERVLRGECAPALVSATTP